MVEVKGQNEFIGWPFYEWIDGKVIGRDPLIFIEGLVLHIKEHLEDIISKFSISKVTKN